LKEPFQGEVRKNYLTGARVNKPDRGRIAVVTRLHDEEHRHNHRHGEHGHAHGAVDPTITTSERGIWAVKWSFVGLLATALVQIAAAPTARTAVSRRSVPSPKTTTVVKRATTPLPTSSQLTRISGASTSKPNAPVALSKRCQAIQLKSVATPATAKRRRERAQGQAARTAAVSIPATMA
jgi:hypothetical protein